MSLPPGCEPAYQHGALWSWTAQGFHSPLHGSQSSHKDPLSAGGSQMIVIMKNSSKYSISAIPSLFLQKNLLSEM